MCTNVTLELIFQNQPHCLSKKLIVMFLNVAQDPQHSEKKKSLDHVFRNRYSTPTILYMQYSQTQIKVKY